MIELSGLACSGCGSIDLREGPGALSCAGCETSFPILCGVVDFRDADRDLSEQFDIGEDRAIAARMAVVFDELRTFNELRDLYFGIVERMRDGRSIEQIDPRAIIAEDGIAPRPMSPDQIAHGDAIVDKVPLYLDDAKLQPIKTGTALEDGCGEGYFIDALSRRFDRLSVLDISLPFMLLASKIAEERGLTNVVLTCASAERLPFADDQFDFIHSNNVIEHVTDQAALFAEANRVVRDDGLLFMISPNRFSLYYEPHFRIPMFGFIPTPIRRAYVRRRQARDIDEIKSRSLGELKRLADARFDSVYATFIPRHLRSTATGGAIRAMLTSSLNSRAIGAVANWAINRAALAVMPYHVLLCARRRAPDVVAR